MMRAWWERLSAELETRPATVVERADRTRAAVLVPLQAVDEDVHVVYTRRAASLPHHGGQVAFPGGTHDRSDASLVATALREADEEIGLRPEVVRLLGRLDDIETVSSRFVITPFVGMVPHPYVWRLAPGEVDTVFSVPLQRLLEPDAERREVWDFGGHRVPIDLFPVDEHVIWGATHRITRILLELVRSL